LYERVPNKPEVDRLTLTPPQPQPVMSTQQNILKRSRPFDEINGSDGKFHYLIRAILLAINDNNNQFLNRK